MHNVDRLITSSLLSAFMRYGVECGVSRSTVEACHFSRRSILKLQLIYLQGAPDIFAK